MKKGLILEGGAMRGLFTAGAIDVMMENHIRYDGLIGVSAGAAFGCNYKSEQLGRVIRYNKRFCKDPRYCSFRSLIRTGNIYNAEFCYHTVPTKFDRFDTERFASNPMEFHLVCTDVTTGKAVYKKCDRMEREEREWLRASASMPLISQIVEIGGYKLLDGGIADSIPIRYMESLGYDRNVIVLTQPEGYIKKASKILPLIKIALRKYPEAARAIEKRHEVYNETLSYIRKKEEKGDLLAIRPEAALDVGRIEHQEEKMDKAYNAGRAAGAKHLAEIKRFLQI